MEETEDKAEEVEKEEGGGGGRGSNRRGGTGMGEEAEGEAEEEAREVAREEADEEDGRGGEGGGVGGGREVTRMNETKIRSCYFNFNLPPHPRPRCIPPANPRSSDACSTTRCPHPSGCAGCSSCSPSTSR